MMKRLNFTTLLICLLAFSGFSQEKAEAYFGSKSNTLHKTKARKLNFEQPFGAYLTKIIGNSAAEKNDFQPFDYIYQVDDQQLDEETDFGSLVDEYQSGDRAKIYFVRKGEKMMKRITFGKESDAEKRHRSRDEDPFLGIGSSHDKVPNDVVGIAVKIIDNSTAEKMGMASGDIITHINDYPIYDWHDVTAAIEMLEVGENIAVKFLREEKMYTLEGPIQSVARTHDTEEAEEEIILVNEEGENLGEIPQVAISMENVLQEEADEMKTELGIDMPIVQNLSIEALNIFPNPSRGIFNLEFTLPQKGQTAIRIFDANGKRIMSRDLGTFQGEYQEQFDLTNSPAGNYFLMIQQGKYSISKKVIIVRM